jgi:hypothetical protein
MMIGTTLALLLTGLAVPPAGADHPEASHSGLDLQFSSQNSTDATNSDLAFWGDLAVAGNYNGFRIFDISTDPPTLVTNYLCDGPQNDVSLWDRDGDGEADILFLSVDQVMENELCGAPRQIPVTGPYDADDWEGIRIFDISDPALPVQIDTIYQDCGSHTHTLVPDLDGNRVLLYNSSYSLRSGPTCGPVEGPAAGRAPDHGVIQVSEVSWDPDAPLAGVTASEIAEPAINYPGDPDNVFDPCPHGGVLCEPDFHPLRACHDVGVHLGVMKAVGACAEQTQLWNIDPDTLLPDTADPVWVFDDPTDTDGPGGGDVAIDFMHTARFTWDGKFVQADDESFGSGCPPTTTIDGVPSDTGRTHFLRGSDGKRLSIFMIPRPDASAGSYCSMHQGNMIPAPGRYLSVNAWYTGGVNIIDFTSKTNPKEIAYFDFTGDGVFGSDNWAHYWYETNPKPGSPVWTFGQDGVHNPPTGRGFEVFTASVGIGKRAGVDHMNPQTIEATLP